MDGVLEVVAPLSNAAPKNPFPRHFKRDYS
jgi:hypothetical protein